MCIKTDLFSTCTTINITEVQAQTLAAVLKPASVFSVLLESYEVFQLSEIQARGNIFKVDFSKTLILLLTRKLSYTLGNSNF